MFQTDFEFITGFQLGVEQAIIPEDVDVEYYVLVNLGIFRAIITRFKD